MKRREDTRYYHWLRSTGIPGSQRNVQYYLQLIATIKTDIDTSDAQMNAIHAMSADPYQSQTLQNMSKMRKQMVSKMHDCQTKLEKQKKNVLSLYAQKAEYEQRLDIPVQGCTRTNACTYTRGVDFNQNTRYRPRSHTTYSNLGYKRDVHHQKDVSTTKNSVQGTSTSSPSVQYQSEPGDYPEPVLYPPLPIGSNSTAEPIPLCQPGSAPALPLVAQTQI